MALSENFWQSLWAPNWKWKHSISVLIFTSCSFLCAHQCPNVPLHWNAPFLNHLSYPDLSWSHFNLLMLAKSLFSSKGIFPGALGFRPIFLGNFHTQQCSSMVDNSVVFAFIIGVIAAITTCSLPFFQFILKKFLILHETQLCQHF